jgi:hypothetical protein
MVTEQQPASAPWCTAFELNSALRFVEAIHIANTAVLCSCLTMYADVTMKLCLSERISIITWQCPLDVRVENPTSSMLVFWVVKQCGLVGLKMEAVCSTETLDLHTSSYRVKTHKTNTASLTPWVTQISHSWIYISYFCQIHSSITSPSMPRSLKWSLPLRFSDQNLHTWVNFNYVWYI